jgi:hypothetical protein
MPGPKYPSRDLTPDGFQPFRFQSHPIPLDDSTHWPCDSAGLGRTGADRPHNRMQQNYPPTGHRTPGDIISEQLLASSAPKGNIGDYIPQWAADPPKNLPPRPGTPEYDEFKRRARRGSRSRQEQRPSEPKADRLRRGCLPTALSGKKGGLGKPHLFQACGSKAVCIQKRAQAALALAENIAKSRRMIDTFGE